MSPLSLRIVLRSPRYPSVPLTSALEDAKAIYERAGRSHLAPYAAATALGYSSLSGPARSRLSALKHYGLLAQKRGSDAQLTQRALTLVLRNPASREYQAALREAALEPPLFRDLAQTRLDASEDSLRHHLIAARGFTDTGAAEFASAFRQTMALAGVTEATTRHDEGNFEGISEATEPPDGTPHGPKYHTTQRERVPLRLLGGRLTAVVELPHPMTEQAWRQMTTMLEALKPGYVAEDATLTPELP